MLQRMQYLLVLLLVTTANRSQNIVIIRYRFLYNLLNNNNGKAYEVMRRNIFCNVM